MKRIAVIGCGGAGKSTLARALSVSTGLPVIHLDQLYWRPGWEPTPRDEWLRVFDAAVARDEWILDGNYGVGTGCEADSRFDRADTVVFLDLRRMTCMRRAVGRMIRHRGAARPDMAEGCPEQFDLGFLRWIWRYGRTSRPGVLELLDRLDDSVRVHHLRSPSDISNLLDAM